MNSPAQVDPRPPNYCFGCGEANSAGMHLPFTRDAASRKVTGSFRLGERYQGAPGIAHGGIVALVLDEALSKVSKFFGASAVTAELNVEYLRPVRLGEEIFVEAVNDRVDGRQLYHSGEIRDSLGRVLARARGRFVAINAERFIQASNQTSNKEVQP
ncbi:MAG TPA: PaaI family thioesterase [Candidatus Acidoferrales bacterium]|nr:PaaI family thioesterase [Candidatus Acidoferrales bacterium]